MNEQQPDIGYGAAGAPRMNDQHDPAGEQPAADPALASVPQATAERELKHLIEATLLAAGRPVTSEQLLDLFDARERPTTAQLQAALAQLEQDYDARGIELLRVASGWRIQVRARYVTAVSRLWQERPSKYSRALLETLALVAYRQPITRGEIEEIRGVSISSTIMRTLQERAWIRVVGHREVPGRPELLGTTREFLDYFGLTNLDELPTLAELKDLETVGVQLELPGEDVPAHDVADIARESLLGARADDLELADPDPEADDVSVGDCEIKSIWVAAADDELDAGRHISAPRADGR